MLFCCYVTVFFFRLLIVLNTSAEKTTLCVHCPMLIHTYIYCTFIPLCILFMHRACQIVYFTFIIHIINSLIWKEILISTLNSYITLSSNSLHWWSIWRWPCPWRWQRSRGKIWWWKLPGAGTGDGRGEAWRPSATSGTQPPPRRQKIF